MIFKDIISKQGPIFRNEIERIINVALKSQKHPCDLLLWVENGFYNPEVLNFKSADGKKLNPHVIGPDADGHSEMTHYEFIHDYRTTHISDQQSEEYWKSFNMESWNAEKSAANDKRTKKEELTIHLETLIYLKIWESDMFIKRLYQLVRLLNGDNYDWYFRVQESNRDIGATGSRQDIIRNMIREPIQKHSKILYDAIQLAYKTQIRNSIAHSKYAMWGRGIHLNNYIKSDPASQLKVISFNQWAEIFHTTLLIYSEIIGVLNLVNRYYVDGAFKVGNVLPIMVTEKDGKNYELPFQYRPESKTWGYKQD